VDAEKAFERMSMRERKRRSATVRAAGERGEQNTAHGEPTLPVGGGQWQWRWRWPPAPVAAAREREVETKSLEETLITSKP